MYNINEKNIHIKNTIINNILSWSLSKEKFLNVISPPYNSLEIFLKTIMIAIRNKKKIIYITNEKQNNVILINKIKEYTNFKDYTYYNGAHTLSKKSLVITSANVAKNINEKFDLVIYDDIKSFSTITREKILEIVMKLKNNHGKIITYSIEKVFDYGNKITLPIRENFAPIIEPKFIETKIDINKDIPYMIYEYIKWSIKNNKNMIIFVPDECKVKNAYSYLYKYCNNLTPNIIKYINETDSNDISNTVKQLNNCLIVTNNMDFDFKNINVMVFFAHNKEFNYKKLVYICGKVGINENRHNGEAIFLGNYETDDIDKVKKLMRYFNKEAWEMNLLRI